MVDGGAERFDSVANALARVPDSVPFVAVHDAVRPLTPSTVIDAVFARPRTNTAPRCRPFRSPTRSSRWISRRIAVTGTVPRDGLWQAQTPQVFRRDWLAEAYAKRSEFTGPITDDAQLVEALGHPVVVVPGSPVNFKITTKDDLDLGGSGAEGSRRRSRASRARAAAFDDEAKW